MFKAFNGLGIIAFSFGDAMLPEIQVNDLITLLPIDTKFKEKMQHLTIRNKYRVFFTKSSFCWFIAFHMLGLVFNSFIATLFLET